MVNSTVNASRRSHPVRLGEVYVLNDGGEVDLDLGNYERYMDVTLSRDHNITTGKIYKEVIEKEVGPCFISLPSVSCVLDSAVETTSARQSRYLRSLKIYQSPANQFFLDRTSCYLCYTRLDRTSCQDTCGRNGPRTGRLHH